MSAKTAVAVKEIEKCLKWQLTIFELTSLDLTEIPEIFDQLTQLEHLNLSYNQLKFLSPCFQHLKQLKILSLAHNQFREIPAAVFQLPNLTLLDVSYNQITQIPGRISSLNHLEELDLSHNQIKELPPALSRLKRIKKIAYQDNPLKIPPLEIREKGSKAVLHYLNDLDEQRQKISEAKITIVGEGGVGKTSLMKKLLHPDFNLNQHEKSTQGIDIEKWLFKDQKSIAVNFWDFGGQMIYRCLHQLFFTSRTLYLFVWQARRDDIEIEFNYWLHMIKWLGRSSPVIVILNKIDDRVKQIDEHYYQTKFDNIIGFHQISVKENRGIEPLREHIRQAVINLPQLQQVIPRSWLDYREKVSQLACFSISYQKWLEIGNSLAIDSQICHSILEYYHDIGVFLYFPALDQAQEIILVQPEWFVQSIYRILDSFQAPSHAGHFTRQDLQTLWHDLSPEKRHFLFQFLISHQLCFQVPGKNVYCIPELLSGLMPLPDIKPARQNISLKYEYEFLPVELMSKVLVYCQAYIKAGQYWSNGVILALPENEVIICFQQEKLQLLILIQGQYVKNALALLQEKIEMIHQQLLINNACLSVQCNCEECRSKQPLKEEAYYFKMTAIAKFKERGINTVYCEKSALPVYIDQLMGERVFNSIAFPYANLKMDQAFFDNLTGTHQPRQNYEKLKLFLFFPPELNHEQQQLDLSLQSENIRLMKEQEHCLESNFWSNLKQEHNLSALNQFFEQGKGLDYDLYFFFIFKNCPDFSVPDWDHLAARLSQQNKQSPIQLLLKTGYLSIDDINQEVINTIYLREELKKRASQIQSYRSFKELDQIVKQVLKSYLQLKPGQV